jgi:hypothetical protein
MLVQDSRWPGSLIIIKDITGPLRKLDYRATPDIVTHDPAAAPMLMSATPGRAPAMAPAPVEPASYEVIDNDRQILQHRQWAGALVVFIPWRGAAGGSGAANFGFGVALLLDLVRLPAPATPFTSRGRSTITTHLLRREAPCLAERLDEARGSAPGFSA